MGESLRWTAAGLAASALATGAPPAFATDAPTAWQLLDDGDPTPQASLMVYDSARRHEVLVTHDDGYMPAVTWELIGEDWVRRFLPQPTPRFASGSCGAFDPIRGVVVIFGGRGNDGSSTVYSDETWEFDGVAWTLRIPAHHPSSRFRCATVFDTDRNKLVLFGGYSTGFTGVGETWEYDGMDWTQITTSSAPSARGDAAMAFDSSRGVAVLFAGRNGDFVMRDTWEYDGRRWRLQNPANAPSARGGAGMAYDPSRARTVLFGGATPFEVYGDTWEWNGTAWTPVTIATLPEPRWRFAMVWDPLRSRIVAQGGQTDNGAYNTTWIFDGTDWARVAESQMPAARAQFAMTYDPALDRVIVYGGSTVGPGDWLSDTWHLQGGAWTYEPNAGEPDARVGLAIGYDPARGHVRGFSGATPAAVTLSIHDYEGAPSVWSSVPGDSPGPDGRYNYGWTHAPPFGGFLMFGGWACCILQTSYYPADDTWVLRGSQWVEITPPARPPAHYEHGLAFDVARGSAVLYGGRLGTGTPAADTWVFDGTTWALVESASPPGARTGVALAYHHALERTVLYGSGPSLEGVTWEFDGARWIVRSTPFQPDPHRISPGLAYDSKQEVVLLFAGRSNFGPYWFNDTWAYGTDPDLDGFVGGLDNCRQVPNTDQANTDGDPAGDACDCAPAEPAAFAAPLPVAGLFVSGGASTTLTWSDQSGAVGSGVRYDVATGTLSMLRAGSVTDAACLASQTATTSAGDPRAPSIGDGYWYLVRARNVCGIGSYDLASLDAASPCP